MLNKCQKQVFLINKYQNWYNYLENYLKMQLIVTDNIIKRKKYKIPSS